MDITLIVKASNQQFDDQTIKCEPSWTIRRLKGHLTEVYPGKPSTDEQKLIYSGQLLSDSVVLKDVLRHYDGQQAHTVHLVFTPKNNRHQKDTGSSGGKVSATSSITSMSPKPASERSVPTATDSRASNEPARADSSGAIAAGPSNSTYGADGMRHRHIAHAQQHAINAAPGIPTAATVPTSPITPVSAEFLLSQQLAVHNWMQQTYMEYLNQYMNVISNGQANTQTLFPSGSTNFTMPSMPQNVTPAAAPSVGAANANPVLSQTLPNLAYYPYLSTTNSLPMPSASSIPAPISSSGSIAGSSAHPVGAIASGSSSQPTFPTAGVSSSVAGSTTSASASSERAISGSSTSAQASSSTATTAVDGTIQNQGTPGTAAAAPAAAGPAAGAAAAPARRFPNIVVEEQENRDWLDIFFSLCRVGILMTVVYLYSSPTRCLTVLIIGIMLYLYQMGFFRNNNAERIERARRIVVQQINNAHGARMNAAARIRAPQAAPEAARGDAPVAPNPAADISTASQTSSNVKTLGGSSSSDQNDGAKINSLASEESAGDTNGEIKTEPRNNTNAEKEPTDTEAEALGSEANDAEQLNQSNAAPEANRVNINDVAAFLRTLVLSFFTSIIPDTPAA